MASPPLPKVAQNGVLASGGLKDFLKQPARLLNSSSSERVPSTSQCRQDDVASQREEATLRAQRLTGSLSQVAVEQLTGTCGGDTSDEDECGDVRCRYGSGVVGFGSPLQVVINGRHKHFADGCGLCSPGRWPPEQRCLSHPWLLREWLLSSLCSLLHKSFDVKKLVCQLAVNMFQESPFSESMLEKGRSLLCQ